jgi:hypothetical protein
MNNRVQVGMTSNGLESGIDIVIEHFKQAEHFSKLDDYGISKISIHDFVEMSRFPLSILSRLEHNINYPERTRLITYLHFIFNVYETIGRHLLFDENGKENNTFSFKEKGVIRNVFLACDTMYRLCGVLEEDMKKSKETRSTKRSFIFH